MTTTHYDEPTDNSTSRDISGTHIGRIARWHWDTTQDGRMTLAVEARLTQMSNVEVRGNLYFDTDRVDTNGRTSADRSMEALNSAGFLGDLSTLDQIQDNSVTDGWGDLTSGDVSVVVEMNTKGYPRAKFINGLRKAAKFDAFNAPTPDTKAAFFAQMKARAQGQQMGQRATGATAQQRAPQGQQVQQRPAPQQMQQRPAQPSGQMQRPAVPVQQQQRAQPPRGPQMQPQQPAGFVDEDIPF